MTVRKPLPLQAEPVNESGAVVPTPARHHRFHFLDGMRGLAAILVFFWHTPADLNFHAGHSTYLAVDFFFCLSGFVIAFSYENRLPSLGMKRFTIARFIRVYPAYLLGIVLGAFSRIVLHDTRMGAAQFALLCVVQLFLLPPLKLWPGKSLFPLDDPAWSMFLELIANFAFAWAVIKGVSSIRSLLVAYVLSFIVLAIWIAHGGSIDVGNLAAWKSLFGLARVTLSFVAGVLVLRLFRSRTISQLAGARSGILATAIVLVTCLLLLEPFKQIQSQVFSLFTVTFFFPMLIYFGALCHASGVWARVCSFLGDISYPLYLLHVPLQSLVYGGPIHRAALLHPALRVSLPFFVLLLAMALSHLAYHAYDAPVRSFLTRRYNALSQWRPAHT
jgi:peptidoglycan/LPS O-acetylase OafA/YrhL